MNREDNLLGVVGVLYRWRLPLLGISAATLVLSAIISLFLPNYYRSQTVFLPANPKLGDPVVLSGKYEEPIDYFGSENDVDRMLSIAQSGEVIDFAIKTFSLYTHYEIDSTTKKAKHKVRLHFLKLYTVQKSENGGIELSLEDKDPVFAAAVVKAIRLRVDQINQRFSKNSQMTILGSYEQVLAQKQLQINELGDSLSVLRTRYGVFDVAAQSELIGAMLPATESRLAEAQARLSVFQNIRSGNFADSVTTLQATIKGLETKLLNLKSKDLTTENFSIAKFNEGRTGVLQLETVLREMTDNLALQRESYMQYQAALQAKLSSLYVVEEAEVPVVKARPARSLLVVGACFVALVMSVLGVLLSEYYKEVDWSAVFSDVPVARRRDGLKG